MTQQCHFNRSQIQHFHRHRAEMNCCDRSAVVTTNQTVIDRDVIDPADD